MKYQNTSVTNNQYRTRNSIEEFEKNGLNNLLDMLYVKALMHGVIRRRDSLAFFNGAYEIAAKVRANPALSIEVIRHDIAASIKRHDLRVRVSLVFLDEIVLGLWMMYAILYLQDHKTPRLIRYLAAMKRELTKNLPSGCSSPLLIAYFSRTVPDMIDVVKERFHSPELYPEASDPLPPAEPDVPDVPNVPDVPEVPDASLPPLPANCSEEGKRFYENCLQRLELSLSKQKALELQLEAVTKEKERNAAVEKSNISTLAFNNLLEKKYNKLKKKYDDATVEQNKEKAKMQTLSDEVIEENRQLKEQLNLKIASELKTAHEQPSQSPGDTIKAIFHDLVSCVCDPEYVSDAHVEAVKDLLEQLVDSPSCEAMPPSEKLELLRDIHNIKKKRRELVSRAKEQATEQARIQQMANDKEKTKSGDTINNYYGSVGQQINSANEVKMDKPDELKDINNDLNRK